jgi:hypothetical protein
MLHVDCEMRKCGRYVWAAVPDVPGRNLLFFDRVVMVSSLL